MRLALVTAILLSIVATASAATVKPGLDGYHRTGNYMPVRVVAAAAASGYVRIEGDGVMPISIDAAGRGVDGIFPLLVVGSPTQLIVRNSAGERGSFPLRLQLLSDNQRLVGTIGEVGDAGARLFPGKSVIAVPLDPVRPIRGEALAWEALDAIVCEGPLPEMGDEVYRALLASGVTFAMRATATPDAQRPWRRDGEWWILQHEAVGPRSALAGEVVALPARGWTFGLPRGTRRNVIGSAAIVAILMLGATLLRGRNAVIALAAVTIVSSLTIFVVAQRQSPVRQVHTTIFAKSATHTQFDTWVYQTAPRAAEASVPWFNSRPMLVSPDQIARQRITLACRGDGTAQRITASLEPNDLFITMSKNVGQVALHTIDASDSPAQQLVRELYLHPGVRVLGQWSVDGATEISWPAVVLEISGDDEVITP